MLKKTPDSISRKYFDAVDFREILDDKLRAMKPLREKSELIKALKKAQHALKAEKEAAKLAGIAAPLYEVRRRDMKP